jgi:intracellular multiplication protein IcmJ
VDFIPITLGIARPGSQSKGDKSKTDKNGARDNSGSASSSSGSASKLANPVKQKIFESDGFKCQCCGFESKKYQEILFLNGDSKDHRPKNMATVCIFCHQCFNLDAIAQMRSGVLLWLPEIEQADLHHIARAIYVARISQGPVADAARKALDVLMARREEVKRRLGTDNVYILGSVLKDYLSQAHYAARKKKLDGVRLFPLDRRIIKEADLEFNQFPQILAYWRSKDGPFSGKTPPQWTSIYQQLLQAA